MEPIARYTERLVQVRRDFALYEDRVEVRANWRLGGSFQTRIDLAGLRPQPRTVLVRQRYYRYAGWILAIGLLVAAVMVYNSGGRFSPWAIAGFIVAAIGAMLMLMTRGQVKFARFDREDGKAGLDIGRAGPGRGEFEAFVDSVGKQIRNARRAK